MALYDSIGKTYATTRRTDPRIAAAIADAVGDGASVVNVGAGTGSYEPEQTIVAIEPSRVMIEQRPHGAARAVQAVAEKMPLHDRCADVAIALFTIHHWNDVVAGVREMRRVARHHLVFLTYFPRRHHYWLLRDYFPEVAAIAQAQAVPLNLLTEQSQSVNVETLPIPHDCADGFGAAYWRRPTAYLDPAIRAGISMFTKMPEESLTLGLQRLADDLHSGKWDKRHEHLLTLESLDVGYRIVTVNLRT